jgi:uridine kinase
MVAKKELLQSYSNEQIAKKVIDFCLGKYKFIFISGNGGSGKTTLGKQLAKEVSSRGIEANYIDMDEFMIDSKIRKNTQKEWIDSKNNKRVSYHTWAFKESYHMAHLETIIRSLMQGKDSFYKPKKSNELVNIKGELPLTIIEGVGTAFLKKEEAIYGIFIMCDFKIEIDRRISRARDGEANLSRKEVEEKATERNEQFKVTILPEKNNFDLELSSQEDYSLNIERDDFGIF